MAKSETDENERKAIRSSLVNFHSTRVYMMHKYRRVDKTTMNIVTLILHRKVQFLLKRKKLRLSTWKINKKNEQSGKLVASS